MWVHVGMRGGVDAGWVRKTLHFWQKRSPNCDFLVLHSPSALSSFKKIWRVGSAWGVRRVWFGWEKFSIVFTPYSIDYSKNLCSLFPPVGFYIFFLFEFASLNLHLRGFHYPKIFCYFTHYSKNLRGCIPSDLVLRYFIFLVISFFNNKFHNEILCFCCDDNHLIFSYTRVIYIISMTVNFSGLTCKKYCYWVFPLLKFESPFEGFLLSQQTRPESLSPSGTIYLLEI
jgi:hypothetical protein